jgi:Leucine-rich repeat (LRR) protein
MKKLLLILLCLPMIGFGQQTYVPDDNFEAYLEANGMGNGIANDDYVTTASIDTVTYLYVDGQNISDLTGIEYFTALEVLWCGMNPLTTLDVSNNTALYFLRTRYNQLTTLDVSGATSLTTLDCNDNNLTNLDVSSNLLLEDLSCDWNQLTSLDVSTNTLLNVLECNLNQLTTLDVSTNTLLDVLYCNDNQLTTLNVSTNTLLEELECWSNNLTSLDIGGATSLTDLYCFNNNLTNLDVSTNVLLEELRCGNNQLTNLDIRNGNNSNLDWLDCTNTPNLICINVDDIAWSTVNWTVANGNIDTQHYFSNNCNPSAIKEYTINKEVLKVTDLLGRETKQTNQPLFYIYDDGTVEKKIVIEQ